MATLNNLSPVTRLTDRSMLIVSDDYDSKKITFLDFKSNLLTPASKTSAGLVKIGKGLLIDETGVLSINPAALIDPVDLPPATNSVLGAVIVGNGLTIDLSGVLSASSNPIVERDSVISANYSIANNKTATSVGPITIDRAVTVEISRQSTWVLF
jgi:hypothetical protein